MTGYASFREICSRHSLSFFRMVGYFGGRMTIQRTDFQAPLWTKHMGRRHRVPRDEDNYFLPGDLQEAARLKLQDDLMRLVWGALYYAPLNAPRSIIDIACGDALWGYQMAKQFPGGRVVSLDIDSVP